MVAASRLGCAGEPNMTMLKCSPEANVHWRAVAKFGWNVVIKDMVSLYGSAPIIVNQTVAISTGPRGPTKSWKHLVFLKDSGVPEASL